MPCLMARVLSGIQPTGDFHLGNYIGAVRHWAANQDVDDSFFVIVDLHAISYRLPESPETLRRKSLELAALLLAAGIDPERSTLFVQSHVPEHTELAWILACVTGFGELRRMTQFKDKSQRGGEGSATAGLFTYPVLQAADILLYRTERVPVGEDQRQHLELTRDVAQRFNQRFGDVFVLPEAAIPVTGARIMDLQSPTAKMSKSAESPQGTIAALEAPESIERKIRTAVTDSGRDIVASSDKPAVTNLLTILSVVTATSVEDLERSYQGKGYADLKADLSSAVVAFLRPLRERTAEILEDRVTLDSVLARGAEKASEVAAATLAEVYDRVGFVPRMR